MGVEEGASKRWNNKGGKSNYRRRSKCGSIDKALQVFESAPKKALSCWNSLLLGLAMNGRENEAVHLFSMLESSNCKPDHVSFLGVLTACNHGGMVNRETDYFLLMTKTFKIELSIEHYSCMVDVLDRAGLLEETEELIRSMPVNPSAVILGGGGGEYGKIEMAKRAAKHVTE
ncbi:pentatricopeptide repeat-containing protein [Populus alba x Populus x berolinensis]|nr:pentatricopeptide repeat-containing protein [Populus alba x Populus x berolinensis]